MDRRTFLTLGAGTAAAVATGATLAGPAAARAGSATARGTAARAAAAGLVWAADFAGATDSDGAGFGNVQTQQGGGSIRNGGDPIPVVDHPQLGRALRLTLAENGERLEAAPGAGDDLGEGDAFWFRVDFALDEDFPVDQDNPFCLVNQIHHGGDSGSPPIEFDVANGRLSVRGASTAYTEDLAAVEVATKYQLVYHVVFSPDPDASLLEVWVDGDQKLAGFHPPCATMIDGNSYWKGATMYCDPDIPPLTVFQNAHRIGTSYAAVTA